jgi:tetratricopeptide (TPR) repeat protein
LRVNSGALSPSFNIGMRRSPRGRYLTRGASPGYSPRTREGEGPAREDAKRMIASPVMAGRYGMSFAAELLERGKYEEAIDAATNAVEAEKASPEPLADRAAAYDSLERYAEAAVDLEQALALNAAAPVLDQDNLDDAFFSALVGAAKIEAETSVDAGVALLARYPRVLPRGRHLQDSEDWRRRLRGELRSLLEKTSER